MSYLHVFLTVTVFLFCMVVSLASYGGFMSENSVLFRIFGTYVADTAVEWSQLHCCSHPMLVWGLNLGEYPRWELMHTCELQECVKQGLIIWILDRSCWWKDNIRISSRYRLCVCVCVCVRSLEQIRIVTLWSMILDFGNTTMMIHIPRMEGISLQAK